MGAFQLSQPSSVVEIQIPLPSSSSLPLHPQKVPGGVGKPPSRRSVVTKGCSPSPAKSPAGGGCQTPPNHRSFFPKKAAVASAKNQLNLGSLQSRPGERSSLQKEQNHHEPQMPAAQLLHLGSQLCWTSSLDLIRPGSPAHLDAQDICRVQSLGPWTRFPRNLSPESPPRT